VIGTLKVWFPAKGYAIVSVSFTKNYFLHASNIVEISTEVDAPPVGSQVQFDAAPPCGNGKLPQAVNARIVSSAGGAH
jgi:cold shock CspA family protein